MIAIHWILEMGLEIKYNKKAEMNVAPDFAMLIVPKSLIESE